MVQQTAPPQQTGEERGPKLIIRHVEIPFEKHTYATNDTSGDHIPSEKRAKHSLGLQVHAERHALAVAVLIEPLKAHVLVEPHGTLV